MYDNVNILTNDTCSERDSVLCAAIPDTVDLNVFYFSNSLRSDMEYEASNIISRLYIYSRKCYING